MDMSSPELRNINGDADESSLAGRISAARQKRIDIDPASERVAVLSSRFDSLRLIGECGGAAFYLARERRANAHDGLIRLKVFSGNAESDSRQLELFRLEATAAAKLSHRNIVKTGLPKEIEGVHFSVMECHAERTLKDLLDRAGWLDAEVAVEIVRQVADALEYADTLGVLHLRIQPESILIDSDGSVRLTDFGLEAGSELAWAHQERSHHSAAHYISPEQVSGQTVDSRSDLYSLGILLYKMLTDRLPFDSANLSAIRQKHVTHSPPPPHLYGVDLPLWMSEVITRLLEKDPANRFQDAASFRQALDRSDGSRAAVLQSDDLTDCEEAAHDEPLESATDATAQDAGSQILDRELWELPSITAWNTSDDEIIPIEPEVAKEPPTELQQSDAGERVDVEPFLFENSPYPSEVTRERKRHWLIWAAVVALALGIAWGLIALVRADRARSLLQTPAREGESAIPVEPAANGAEGGSAIVNGQPAVDPKPSMNNRPGAARPGRARRTRSTNAYTTERKTVQSSPSRRYRPTKRKPRARRQWRNSFMNSE
jgi:serine/threonine protein kinase